MGEVLDDLVSSRFSRLSPIPVSASCDVTKNGDESQVDWSKVRKLIVEARRR